MEASPANTVITSQDRCVELLVYYLCHEVLGLDIQAITQFLNQAFLCLQQKLRLKKLSKRLKKLFKRLDEATLSNVLRLFLLQ